MDERTKERWSVALVALISFAVYLPRVCPTLSLMGDSAVFVSAAANWGVPQPSGYPLWTFLGHLVTKLPGGEVAWRLHVFSAICHSLTVGLVALTLLRLRAPAPAAIGGALVLAFSRAFFLGSLYAEVFPLNDLFTALAIFTAIDVVQAAPEDREKRLVRFVLVAGLASAHHQTIALVAPGIAVMFWKTGVINSLDRRLVQKLASIFVAPLLLFYAALYFRAKHDPTSNWGDVHDLSSLVALATRQDYGGLGSPHLGTQETEWSTLVEAWFEGTSLSFGWVLMLVGALGLVSLVRREEKADRPYAWMLGLALLVSGPLFAVANALEVASEHGKAFAERFSTMSAVPLALLIGVGLSTIVRVTEGELPKTFVRVAVGLAFVFPLGRHAAACDLRADRRGIALAHDIFRGVPDGSLVLITGDALNGAVLYVCGVEKRCGRTVAFSPGQMHLDWRVAQLKRRHPELVFPTPASKFITVRELVGANLGARPVFLSPQLLNLEPPLREAFQYIPDGLMVRALPDEIALEAEKPAFVERARQLARGESCQGCGISRADLLPISLETSIPPVYALAFENHSRILSAWFPAEGRLAAFFAERAQKTDPEAIK
ncbi:MAG: glycosyltransferase family 117 protein [Polyangiales bacterium]